MKGYKAFNSDLSCRDFQYEIGKTYTLEEEPIICKHGFHFCDNIIDCFNYYPFDGKTRIAEVESLGIVIKHYKKNVTSKIRIIREIPPNEQFELLEFDKELCQIFFKINAIIRKLPAQLGSYWGLGSWAGSSTWILYRDLGTRARYIDGRVAIEEGKIKLELYDEYYNENIILNMTSNSNINREILEEALTEIKSADLHLLIEELIKIF